jgi:hypothetical protein
MNTFMTVLYNSTYNTYTYDTICDELVTAVKRINNFKNSRSIVIYKFDGIIERYNIEFHKYTIVKIVNGPAVTSYNIAKPMNAVLKTWDSDTEHQLIFCN